MKDWLQQMDSSLFSPPHTFQTVLAFVAGYLGLAADDGAEAAKAPETQAPEEAPGVEPAS